MHIPFSLVEKCLGVTCSDISLVFGLFTANRKQQESENELKVDKGKLREFF